MSPLQHAHQAIESMRSIPTAAGYTASGGLLLLSNAAAWVMDFNASTVAGWITVISTALVAAVVGAITAVSHALAKAYKLKEETQRDSLTEQLEEMRQVAAHQTESLAKLRESLHASRNEAAARELRHQAEVERLMGQLQWLQSENDRLHRGQSEIGSTVDEVASRTKRIARAVNTPDPDSEVEDGEGPAIDIDPDA